MAIVKIQHRRGNYNDYDPTKVLPGELVVTQANDPNSSDGKAVYIGTTSGDVKQLVTKQDMKAEIETLISQDVAKYGGLSNNAKLALLNILRKVAYIDGNGQTYYNVLQSALYANTYPGIKVTFNPGANVIYTDTPLNDLKQYLTVKYYESASSSGTTISSSNYTISGSLFSGDNTLTVTYNIYNALFGVTAVDFYNDIWQWALGTNMQKLSGGPTIANGKLTISQNETQLSTRRTIAVNHGKEQYIQYQSLEPLGVYPIPIPENSNKVTVTITPSTQYLAVQLYTFENGTYTLREYVAWTQGSAVINFVKKVNGFCMVGAKMDSGNSTPYTTEPSAVTVVYEEV